MPGSTDATGALGAAGAAVTRTGTGAADATSAPGDIPQVALIADGSSCRGFAAFGVAEYPVDVRDADAVRRVFIRLVTRRVPLLWVTEDVAELLGTAVEAAESAGVQVLVLPSAGRKHSNAGARLEALVVEALGSAGSAASSAGAFTDAAGGGEQAPAGQGTANVGSDGAYDNDFALEDSERGRKETGK
ncbi:MAG: V-type ATP synthase subunit F [Actinomycetes bacterium]|jgi:vacuolar-type H+-ATPase subunit F/Vma7|nr:V-type ATP synthase subunit F [Actinomycetes bacterium]